MERQTWPLGLYCERTALGFWGEPLNAVSNLAFIVAAAVCLRLALRHRPKDAASLWLIILVVLIGFGSTAFHTLPSRTTVLMDVIPIGIFIVSAIVFAVRRYLAMPWWLAILIGLAFAGLSPFVGRSVADMLPRGSAGYVPALLAMPLIAGAMLWRAGRNAGLAAPAAVLLKQCAGLIALAAVVFAVSLTLRTLDQPFCPQNPLGLHFLWHLLNAVVLGLITWSQLLWGEAGTPNKLA